MSVSMTEFTYVIHSCRLIQSETGSVLTISVALVACIGHSSKFAKKRNVNYIGKYSF